MTATKTDDCPIPGYRWGLPSDTHRRARYKLQGSDEFELLPFSGPEDPYFMYEGAARPMVAIDRRDDAE